LRARSGKVARGAARGSRSTRYFPGVDSTVRPGFQPTAAALPPGADRDNAHLRRRLRGNRGRLGLPDGEPRRQGVSFASLADAGGGTEVFTTAVWFAGTFLFVLFVLFVGAVAVEFSRGTFRTMLLHQRRQLRLRTGKMAGLLLFAAVVVAAAEALTWLAARLLAPSQDVATGEWISAAAVGDALADCGSVL
jgi:hypothetical protein